MKPEEIALILEQAKQYTDSQQLAHTSKEVKTITWDGVTEGRPIINFGNNDIAKISDAPIDFVKETPIKVTARQGEQEIIISQIQTSTEEINGVLASVLFFENDEVFAMYAASFSDTVLIDDILCEKGLYFFTAGSSYISEFVYNAQTIHPIPAEYIPPLDSLIFNGTDGKQYRVTVDGGTLSAVEIGNV